MNNEYISALVAYLNIKKPFEIKLLSKSSNTRDAAYWAWNYPGNKIKKHEIHIYLGNLTESTRNFPTLLAHEFVHAWQAENQITEVHGEYFGEAAEFLEYNLRKSFPKLNVRDIYIPGQDI